MILPFAKADPGNAVWQRDLSVSYEKVGEVLRAQGNLAAALDAAGVHRWKRGNLW